jgi:cation transport protein ChaC
MPIPAEAFRHVPALAGRIIDPEQSFFRGVLERYAELDRVAAEHGYPTDWRLSHEAREATRRAALVGRAGDLWLFAYGSLMWDPAVQIAEIRTATLEGFHRRFCLKTTLGRGSPANPGLMAALDRGGQCHGLAFRIRAEEVEHETAILWAREMISAAYMPIFAAVDTPQGSLEALAFAIDPATDRYLAAPPEETARMILNGRGRIGTNLEYLDKLADRLELLGVRDPHVDDLRQRARAGLPSTRA